MFKSLVKSIETNHQVQRLVEMAYVVSPTNVARRVIEERCRRFSPVMVIDDRVVSTTFDKVDILPRSGHVVAYYTGRVRRHGVLLTQTARYRVRDEGMTLEHIFPIRAKR